MYSGCTCMYSVCTVHVQCMYSVCTVHVQCMYSVCTVYVQCMYSVCTVSIFIRQIDPLSHFWVNLTQKTQFILGQEKDSKIESTWLNSCISTSLRAHTTKPTPQSPHCKGPLSSNNYTVFPHNRSWTPYSHTAIPTPQSPHHKAHIVSAHSAAQCTVYESRRPHTYHS